ncbi:MAG: glycosyltransferase [Bacteroidales bacterium]|jgi:hypothetical protein|nr:glycosyltransferase [Bacteroidales bacterium]
MPITFVVPVNREDIYQRNFLASPLLRTGEYQIIAQTGYRTAGEAFNDAIDRAANDIMVFCHQDVLLPTVWAKTFINNLLYLESVYNNIGVVGCFGATMRGQLAGHVYQNNREISGSTRLPAEVDTLDDLLICFRKSKGIRFDEKLPEFALYSQDVCIQAKVNGRKNFAVDAPCFHNAPFRDDGFTLSGEEYILEKWKYRLPIYTNCGVLGGCKAVFYKKVKKFALQALGISRPKWFEKYPLIEPEKILHDE